MLEFLKDLRTRVVTGMVGGSDLKKQKEQLGDDGELTDDIWGVYAWLCLALLVCTEQWRHRGRAFTL